MIYDTLIIGAGPAGMTAAIYASRGNLKVGIIERNVPGGQIVYTQAIENYPGFKTINGVDLAMAIYEQTMEKNVDFLYEDVTSLIKNDDGLFSLKTSENEHQAKTVIVATGQANRKLSVPGEDRLIGKGISFCALCDGALYKDKDVLVVGGGNSAFEESLYLASV
jgi:thioredoxin reductase (NADPH)